jgi:hypothetical protein
MVFKSRRNSRAACENCENRNARDPTRGRANETRNWTRGKLEDETGETKLEERERRER